MPQDAVRLSFLESFALSGAAAVLSQSAVAPLERVKLLLQNQAEMVRSGRLARPYSGVIECTVHTFRHEGLLAFWRSNTINCVRYFPTQALNFAFKDKLQALVNVKGSEPRPRLFAKNIFSGAAAGALSSCFVYSLDFARTRLANDILKESHAAVVEEEGGAGAIPTRRRRRICEGVAPQQETISGERGDFKAGSGLRQKRDAETGGDSNRSGVVRNADNKYSACGNFPSNVNRSQNESKTSAQRPNLIKGSNFDKHHVVSGNHVSPTSRTTGKARGCDGHTGRTSVAKREYKNLLDVYRKTLRTDGVRGLYRGFCISVLGIVVYRGMYFGLYDSLKPMLIPVGETPVALTFALSYCVTVSSNVVAYPVDTVRRRMMMTTGQELHYRGGMDCFIQIINKEGAMSLMRGSSINVFRSVAGAGVLTGFDVFKDVYLRWKGEDI